MKKRLILLIVAAMMISSIGIASATLNEGLAVAPTKDGIKPVVVATDYDATMGGIATLIVNSLGWQSVAPAPNTYTDLSAGNAHAADILRLVTKGVLDGKGTINADASITREAFFKLFAKIIGTKGVDSNIIYHLTDVLDISAELRPIFSELYTSGVLVEPDTATSFLPKKNITHNEAVTALLKQLYKQMAPKGTTLVPLAKPYFTKNFNRFGNMNPSDEMYTNNYLMKEEPFRIVGDIYYVGNTWAASYLVDTGDGLLLLDTPCWPEFWMLIDSIRALGFDPMDIKKIVVSHGHPDHYGCIQPLLAMNPKIITYTGEIDGQTLINGVKNIKFTKSTYQNQGFVPDVLLKDGDYVELGNTKIKHVLTPGHTKGGMSWFWTVKDNGKSYNIGYYGAAGFSTMALDRLISGGMTMADALAYQQVFLDSIKKVWDEPVDVNIGNHPFHNDTFEKAELNKTLKGKGNAFVDPTEWHRYLTELRESYTAFLKMTPAEVTEMYRVSYLLLFRDKSLGQHVWPWVEDTK